MDHSSRALSQHRTLKQGSAIEYNIQKHSQHQGYLTLKTQIQASWGCQYKTLFPPSCFWQLAASEPLADKLVPGTSAQPGPGGAPL